MLQIFHLLSSLLNSCEQQTRTTKTLHPSVSLSLSDRTLVVLRSGQTLPELSLSLCLVSCSCNLRGCGAHSEKEPLVVHLRSCSHWRSKYALSLWGKCQTHWLSLIHCGLWRLAHPGRCFCVLFVLKCLFSYACPFFQACSKIDWLISLWGF